MTKDAAASSVPSQWPTRVEPPAAAQQDGRSEQGRRDEQRNEVLHDSATPYSFIRLASSTEAEWRERKSDTMIASPTTTSAAATTIVKNAMIWPSRLPCSREKADEGEVAGVEHQLDAHEDHDRVAPDQHAGGADGEQQGCQIEVVDRIHLTPPLGRARVASRPAPTAGPGRGAGPAGRSERCSSALRSASASLDTSRIWPRPRSVWLTVSSDGRAVGQQTGDVHRVVPGVDAGGGQRRAGACPADALLGHARAGSWRARCAPGG